MDSKFWNNIYNSKAENAVSWYQEKPTKSLEIILSLNLVNSAAIIDIGGGQSKLTECLYQNSFRNLSVLDISEVAINNLKDSLSKKITEHSIQFFVSNITDIKFNQKFDLWHDRAVFHFLTNPVDRKKYVELLYNSLSPNGYFLIFTFSKLGPKKCSGLEICQYDKDELLEIFSNFTLVDHGQLDHKTPFETIQNFTFCLFQKK